MHRLLEDFDSIVKFDLPLNGISLGAALERLLQSAELEHRVAWGESGIASTINEVQRDCMHFFYRPHMYPDMETKLELAHQLQFSMLPRTCPRHAPAQLATVLESFCQLSGDLLGWRFLPDGSFLFWILDISGHGLKAGLIGAVLKTIIDYLPHIDTGCEVNRHGSPRPQ